MHPAVLRPKLLPELQQATVSRLSHVSGERDVVDPDPPSPLLGKNISDAVVRRTRHPKHRVPVLQEVLQGGGGGCDTKNSAGICTPDPLNSDAADALPVKGPVDRGRDVVGLLARCVCVVFYLLTRCPRGQRRFLILPFPVPKKIGLEPGFETIWPGWVSLNGCTRG